MNGRNVCGCILGLYVAACPGAGGIGLCRIGLVVGFLSWSPRTGEGRSGHVGRLIGLGLGTGGVWQMALAPIKQSARLAPLSIL